MDKIGVAIIGCGGMSSGHAEAFKNISDVDIIAFSDININKAKLRAEQFTAPLYFSDHEKILNRDDIQIISIVTPPFHHFQTIKDCLSAGKHVLCEKPVILNLAQLDEIENILQTRKLTFGGALQWRFGAGVQQAKTLLDNDYFGQVMYASNNLYWRRTQEYFDVDWRNSWEKSGGGIMFTLACHGLDVLIYLLGDVDHVSAELDSLKYNMEIEDSGTVILRFKNNALGHVAATVNAQRQRSRIEIIGSRLEAISSDDAYGVAYEPWTFRSVDARFENKISQILAARHDQFIPAQHQLLINDFVAAVRSKIQPAVNIDEIRRSLQVLTSIYKANRLKKRIYLPVKNNDRFYANLNPEL